MCEFISRSAAVRREPVSQALGCGAGSVSLRPPGLGAKYLNLNLLGPSVSPTAERRRSAVACAWLPPQRAGPVERIGTPPPESKAASPLRLWFRLRNTTGFSIWRSRSLHATTLANGCSKQPTYDRVTSPLPLMSRVRMAQTAEPPFQFA